MIDKQRKMESVLEKLANSTEKMELKEESLSPGNKPETVHDTVKEENSSSEDGSSLADASEFTDFKSQGTVKINKLNSR